MRVLMINLIYCYTLRDGYFLDELRALLLLQVVVVELQLELLQLQSLQQDYLGSLELLELDVEHSIDDAGFDEHWNQREGLDSYRDGRVPFASRIPDNRCRLDGSTDRPLRSSCSCDC